MYCSGHYLSIAFILCQKFTRSHQDSCNATLHGPSYIIPQIIPNHDTFIRLDSHIIQCGLEKRRCGLSNHLCFNAGRVPPVLALVDGHHLRPAHGQPEGLVHVGVVETRGRQTHHHRVGVGRVHPFEIWLQGRFHQEVWP
uniref:Uncharacterized protein n=1 Tax=Heterosigma akashiwo TaxID=2829 RepID=A0A7S4D582_HETAK